VKWLWQPSCLNKCMSFCCKCRKAVSKSRGWVAVLIFLVFSFPRIICAQSVLLSWAASTDSNVAGYNVYYGSASGVYTNETNVGTNTEATISGLVAGQTYYFALTAYNAAQAESAFSTAVPFLIPGILLLTKGTDSGSMNITFPVAPAHWYEVQASANLVSWTNIWQTATMTSNVWVQYSDSQSSLFSKRFYRLVLH
jgi:hypothetical protein